MFGANNNEAEKELDRTCCTREQFVKADDRGKNDRKEKPRGRPRMGMIDDLKEGNYAEMKRRAEDRDKWRTWMPRTCRVAEN